MIVKPLQIIYISIFLLSLVWAVKSGFDFEPLIALLTATIAIITQIIWKDLKKIFGFSIFSSNNRIIKLSKKYQGTTFYITKNDESFTKDVAEVFLKEIDEHYNYRNLEALQEEKIRIGFICGPMVFDMYRYLLKKRKHLLKKDYSKIVFVSMNKAAERERFYLSANYLASSFSLLFNNSKDMTYTNNPYDQNRIGEERRKVNILFCSVSPISGIIRSYIEDWCEKMKNDKPQIGNITSAIGDFCLTPINTEGFAVGPETFMDLLQSTIDPYPQFDWLGDIKREASYPNIKIILPIKTATTPPRKHISSSDYIKRHITGKELIAKTILQSGIIDTCIINRNLAKNIEESIGFYLIDTVSKTNEKTCLRQCKVFSFRENIVKRILVHDPYGRFDIFDNDDKLKEVFVQSEDAPDIIVSETFPVQDKYNWKDNQGTFNLNVYGRNFEFSIDKGVRKPGQWAIVTYYVLKKQIEKMYKKHLRKISVWDMGCGSGVIGALSAIHCKEMIDSILFSDIDSRAVMCAKTNWKKNEKSNIKVSFNQGSLFNANNNQKYDIIVFNPPFFPDSILPIDNKIDGGGHNGWEIAKEYCDNCKNLGIQPKSK